MLARRCRRCPCDAVVLAAAETLLANAVAQYMYYSIREQPAARRDLAPFELASNHGGRCRESCGAARSGSPNGLFEQCYACASTRACTPVRTRDSSPAQLRLGAKDAPTNLVRKCATTCLRVAAMCGVAYLRRCHVSVPGSKTKCHTKRACLTRRAVGHVFNIPPQPAVAGKRAQPHCDFANALRINGGTANTRRTHVSLTWNKTPNGGNRHKGCRHQPRVPNPSRAHDSFNAPTYT